MLYRVSIYRKREDEEGGTGSVTVKLRPGKIFEGTHQKGKSQN